MAEKISMDSLISIYNGYLADQSSHNFLQYLTSHGFATVRNNRIQAFADNIAQSQYNNGLRYNVSTNKEKLSELFNFVYDNDSIIEDSLDHSKAGVLQDIVATALIERVTLNVKNAENIVEKYTLGDNNPKLKKMKRKSAWVAKKIGIPTLITTALTTVAGSVIGGIASLAGSSIFWSGNILVAISSLAGIGLVSGLVLTPTIIIAKNALTRAHYRLWYGRSKKNFKMIQNANVTEASKVAEQLKDLPIVKLMNKIKNTEETLIEYAKSKNPFKKMRAYFMRKTNRNRMHAAFGFVNRLQQETDRTKTKEAFDKYNTVLEYISQEFSNNMTDNLRLSFEKSTGRRHKVLQNYDIVAKRELSKADSKRKKAVKSAATEITRRVASNVLGGKKLVVDLRRQYVDGTRPIPTPEPTPEPTPTPTPRRKFKLKSTTKNPARKQREPVILPEPPAPILLEDPTKTKTPPPIIYLPGEVLDDSNTKQQKNNDYKNDYIEYSMGGSDYNVVIPDNSTPAPTKTQTDSTSTNSKSASTVNKPKAKQTIKEEEVKSTKTIESDKKVLEFLSGYYDPQKDKFRDDKDIKDNMELFDETISEMTKGALSPKEVADFRKSIKDAQGKTGKFGESLTWHTAKATRTKLKRKQYELLYKLSKIDEKTGISDADYYTSEITKLIAEIEQEKALRAQKTQSKTNNI